MFTQSLRKVVAAADAFATPHGVDRYIEQIVPTWSSTEVRGRIVGIDHGETGLRGPNGETGLRGPNGETGSVVLTIEANGNWAGFRPGQYTQLSVEIDGVRHTRCYSMCSSPTLGARVFQLGIKAHPHGLVSQHLVANATVGTVVGLTPAAGDFHLPDVRPDRTLLISGGSGITPVLSMLRTMCAEGHDGPVTFLHYATAPDAMICRSDVAELGATNRNVRVVEVFDDGSGDLTGLLDESHLDAADSQWRDAEVFVCGPAPLMDSVRKHYADAGVSDRFHQEAFTLPMFAGEAGLRGLNGEAGLRGLNGEAGSIRFGTSDVVVESDGRPLLLQAEAAGLTPKSGCRMGICHTCTRSLTCGTVRDAVTGELTTTNSTAVEIRVCVSIPVGDVEIDL